MTTPMKNSMSTGGKRYDTGLTSCSDSKIGCCSWVIRAETTSLGSMPRTKIRIGLRGLSMTTPSSQMSPLSSSSLSCITTLVR